MGLRFWGSGFSGGWGSHDLPFASGMVDGRP